MKVWITKWTLTRGVFEVDAEVCTGGNGRLIRTAQYGLFHKPDWHTNWIDAEARVLSMVTARITSLEKQVSKLRRLETQLHNKGLDAVIKNSSTSKEAEQ